MILGVIPARGGSKGIPGKNIKMLAGKPLIAWTIEAAHKSKLMDKFVVSTEDKRIKKVVEDLGAEVVDRPKELAKDETSTQNVLEYIVRQLPNVDVVVVLQVTCPIRNESLIDDCIAEFQQSGADSLATGFKCHYRPYGSPEQNRQDIPGFFYDDGNIYIIKADLLRNNDRYGKKHELVYLDREQNIDIDDEFDFWLAEKVMEKRMKNE